MPTLHYLHFFSPPHSTVLICLPLYPRREGRNRGWNRLTTLPYPLLYYPPLLILPPLSPCPHSLSSAKPPSTVHLLPLPPYPPLSHHTPGTHRAEQHLSITQLLSVSVPRVNYYEQGVLILRLQVSGRGILYSIPLYYSLVFVFFHRWFPRTFFLTHRAINFFPFYCPFSSTMSYPFPFSSWLSPCFFHLSFYYIFYKHAFLFKIVVLLYFFALISLLNTSLLHFYSLFLLSFFLHIILPLQSPGHRASFTKTPLG